MLVKLVELGRFDSTRMDFRALILVPALQLHATQSWALAMSRTVEKSSGVAQGTCDHVHRFVRIARGRID